jgi:hypothetical protein
LLVLMSAFLKASSPGRKPWSRAFNAAVTSPSSSIPMLLQSYLSQLRKAGPMGTVNSVIIVTYPFHQFMGSCWTFNCKYLKRTTCCVTRDAFSRRRNSKWKCDKTILKQTMQPKQLCPWYLQHRTLGCSYLVVDIAWLLAPHAVKILWPQTKPVPYNSCTCKSFDCRTMCLDHPMSLLKGQP